MTHPPPDDGNLDPAVAVIANEASGRRCTLGAHTLMGRAPHCGFLVSDDSVSTEHASLSFRDARWWLRDLGSTNGTYLDGQLVEPGRPVAVQAGSMISLGDVTPALSWKVVRLGRPDALARRMTDGQERRASGGMLYLPDDETVRLTVAVSEQRWMAETEAGEHPVEDQSVVQIGDEVWLLELPPPSATGQLPATSPTSRRRRYLAAAEARFRVSRDEEDIQFELRWPDETVPVPQRAFHYLLALLARERVADGERGIPLPDRGWVETEALAEGLRITRQKLNLDVSRARRQLADLGVDDAFTLIERRSAVGRIRLGAARVQVETP